MHFFHAGVYHLQPDGVRLARLHTGQHEPFTVQCPSCRAIYVTDLNGSDAWWYQEPSLWAAVTHLATECPDHAYQFTIAF
jgi:hypothetical protein